MRAAADAVEGYPDGVWLVELALLSEPSLAEQQLATVLGVREEAAAGERAGQTLTDRLVHHLAPAAPWCWTLRALVEACAALAARLVATWTRRMTGHDLRARDRTLGDADADVVRHLDLEIPDGTSLQELRSLEVARILGFLPQSPVASDGITVGDLVGRGRYPQTSSTPTSSPRSSTSPASWSPTRSAVPR